MPALNLDLISVGLATAGGLILGFIIFFQNYKSATNKLFLMLTIVCSGWSVFNYLAYKIEDPSYALWIIRLVMFFAVFQAYSFFLLIHTFPNTTIQLTKQKFLILSIITLLVSILTLTPFLFPKVQIVGEQVPQPVPGMGMPIFALTAVSMVIGGIIILLKRIRNSLGKERIQYIYLGVGVILMFCLIVFFNFIMTVVFSNTAFIPLSSIFTLPFIIFTFYAISKHQLLNIKIVGTEILVLLLIVVTLFQTLYSNSLLETLFNIIVFIALLVVGVLLVRSEIHEMKQREELQNLTHRLQEMDKQKNEFISVAAHELRGPLSVIKGYLSLVLEGDGGKVPPGVVEYLNSAFASAGRMVRLISNMLNVGRIEEGRIIYQMGYIHLIEGIKTVFEEYKQDAKNKGLEVKMEADKGLSDDVYVDKDRILEVIGNFMNNAIKYTDKGTVHLKADNPSPQVIRIEVTDTGPGMKEEEQKQLFQKFYRAKSVATAVSGTGLGLYVSRLLIEAFNGKIGCSSVEGKGSTFWFELPIKKEPAKQEIPVPAAKPAAAV